MALVISALFAFFLIGFFYLLKDYRQRKKLSPRKKILVVLFAFALFILLFKFYVEELYPCVTLGGDYCDFSTSSYNSPLFPF